MTVRLAVLLQALRITIKGQHDTSMVKCLVISWDWFCSRKSSVKLGTRTAAEWSTMSIFDGLDQEEQFGSAFAVLGTGCLP